MDLHTRPGGVTRVNIELWRERFEEHLRIQNYASRTPYTYGLEAAYFLEFLAERGLSEPSEIRRDDVLAYLVSLQHLRKADGTTLKAITRRSKTNVILTFLRYLYEEKFILSNPGADIRRPKAPDCLPPPIPDEEQVEKLLQAPDTTKPNGIKDRALMEVLYATALRNAEIRALLTEDVDLHRLELRVRCGKGGKGRVLPLTEPAAAWLEEYLRMVRPLFLKNADDRTLFLNSWGRPISSEKLAAIVRAHAKTAKLSVKVTPHTLRHACATHMLARRAGIRHLQRFLGHACPSSTERYTRVEVSDLREVMLRCHPRESC